MWGEKITIIVIDSRFILLHFQKESDLFTDLVVNLCYCYLFLEKLITYRFISMCCGHEILGYQSLTKSTGSSLQAISGRLVRYSFE